VRKLLALAFLLVAFAACGQTVVYRNQATLQWDPVTADTAGNPFLPGDTVAYEVFIYAGTVPAPQDPAILTFVGTTSATELLIVFPYRTTWKAGVRVRLTDGGGNVSYSAFAWSDVEEDADPAFGPFWYSPKGTPRKPAGLQDKGT
jgi:hypothetical protein